MIKLLNLLTNQGMQLRLEFDEIESTLFSNCGFLEILFWELEKHFFFLLSIQHALFQDRSNSRLDQFRL